MLLSTLIWEENSSTAPNRVVQAGDPSVSDSEIKEVNTNVQLAQTWLNGVTTVPAASTASKAWCRSEWIGATVSTWQKIVDPVAQRVQNSMSNTLPNLPGVDEISSDKYKKMPVVAVANLSEAINAIEKFTKSGNIQGLRTCG